MKTEPATFPWRSLTPLAAWFSLVALAAPAPAAPKQANEKTMTRLEEKSFGRMADGTPVTLFTLRNTNGMVVKVMNYGAIITELHVPDRHGQFTNVVLGADSLDKYLSGFPA